MARKLLLLAYRVIDLFNCCTERSYACWRIVHPGTRHLWGNTYAEAGYEDRDLFLLGRQFMGIRSHDLAMVRARRGGRDGDEVLRWCWIGEKW
jgi:hypothetical protein